MYTKLLFPVRTHFCVLGVTSFEGRSATLDSSPTLYCRNFPSSKGFLIIPPAKYFDQTLPQMSVNYVNRFFLRN